MGKNRELNPADKLRREEKEKERRKNKNERSKTREIGKLGKNPHAIQDEIRRLKAELRDKDEFEEGTLVLKRNLKRLQNEFNAAISARKKADPRLMAHMGIDPAEKDFAMAASRSMAADPLNPENGGDSRQFARNRALNRPNVPEDNFPGAPGSSAPVPAEAPPAPVAPISRPLSKGLVSLVPSSVRKKKPSGSSAAIDAAPRVDD